MSELSSMARVAVEELQRQIEAVREWDDQAYFDPSPDNEGRVLVNGWIDIERLCEIIRGEHESLDLMAR